MYLHLHCGHCSNSSNTGSCKALNVVSYTKSLLYRERETFQYTHFSFCNPHRVRKGLIKGEALRLLRTNSSAKSFYENIYIYAFALEDTLTIS